jgi:hypothetical protein
MTTVYVVTTGSYSGYGIRSIWSTKELAEKALAQLTDREKDIEEHELDEPIPDRLFYVTAIYRDGTVSVWGESVVRPGVTEGFQSQTYPSRPICRPYHTVIEATDAAHARKIGGEIHARLKAEGWPD